MEQWHRNKNQTNRRKKNKKQTEEKVNKKDACTDRDCL